ncbi:hypothetical protein PM025_03935 [Halorubrum ezzemoulense]|nr:hypothetical protein [Halorubrum ezzemoulense]MDB2263299.1 hypothetical protein [Halorubrum ezzemoulense]MDB9301360.1 hypothetical protein [Halorubrum ezzemoulense]
MSRGAVGERGGVEERWAKGEAAGGGRTADPRAVVGVAARAVGTGARID